VHKEFRFILPALPFLLVASAVGWAHLLERVRASDLVAGGLATLLAGAMAAHASALDFSQMGQYGVAEAGAVSPWHAHEGPQRLLHFTGRRDDLCGVWVQGIRARWTGGYTYLHRRDALVHSDAPDDPQAWAAANYVIRPRAPVEWPLDYPMVALPPAYAPVAGARGWIVYRRDGACGPRPDNDGGGGRVHVPDDPPRSN
jgi:hypothetical protein